MSYMQLDRCLACGGAALVSYVDFGAQALANSFSRHPRGDKISRFPLGLNYCSDCFHSQQKVAVDPDLIYLDYPYASGTSRTLDAYFEQFSRELDLFFADPELSEPRSVLEIASNDGSLLTKFKAKGWRVQGVDPSQLAAEAIKRKVPTIRDYWCADAAAAVDGPFDLIVAMNVLGHVETPLEFLRLCKRVLAPGGRIIVQTSQAFMLAHVEFDTVYHEHLSFFTARSFIALAARAGLSVRSIRHVAIHGGSYSVELRDAAECDDCGEFPVLQSEKLVGYYAPAIYRSFASHITQRIDHLMSTLDLGRREGFRLLGYGAAAKGMTLLNLSGAALDCIIDDAPLKIGKYCPENDIPVYGIDCKAVADPSPIMWLILAWNFKGEVIARIKARRPTAGDRFVVAFPAVEVSQ